MGCRNQREGDNCHEASTSRYILDLKLQYGRVVIMLDSDAVTLGSHRFESPWVLFDNYASSIVDCRLCIIDCRLSIVHHRLSIVDCTSSIVKHRLSLDSCWSLLFTVWLCYLLGIAIDSLSATRNTRVPATATYKHARRCAYRGALDSCMHQQRCMMQRKWWRAW